MKKAEIIELLRKAHGELEAVTDRVGCSFKTAVILTDCENALNEIDGKPFTTLTQGAALNVH